MCTISVLVDCCMTSIPNHLSPPILDRFLSSKVFDVKANLRSISIKQSIRCKGDQSCHGQCRYSQNDYILINGGIRMSKIFGCLWTDHQCCSNRNSKPPFCTKLRPISIQHSIQCPREQYRHGEWWYSQSEHILIKLVIRMVCKISVLAVNWTSVLLWLQKFQTVFLHQ